MSSKPASNSVPSLSIRKFDNEPMNEKPKQEVAPSVKRPLTSRLSGRIASKEDEEDDDELAHTTGPSTISNKFTLSNSASNGSSNGSNNKPSAAMTKVSRQDPRTEGRLDAITHIRKFFKS